MRIDEAQKYQNLLTQAREEMEKQRREERQQLRQREQEMEDRRIQFIQDLESQHHEHRQKALSELASFRERDLESKVSFPTSGLTFFFFH